jgi:hypothetical protein
MKLFKMGELAEGCDMAQSYIGLLWYELITDIPPGIRLQTVLLTFALPLLGTHYDINSRRIRYGWWLHWICFYREDRWPLPVVGVMKSKHFHKER